MLLLTLNTPVGSLPPLQGIWAFGGRNEVGVGGLVKGLLNEIKFKVKSQFLISHGVGAPPSPGRF